MFEGPTAKKCKDVLEREDDGRSPSAEAGESTLDGEKWTDGGRKERIASAWSGDRCCEKNCRLRPNRTGPIHDSVTGSGPRHTPCAR
jgi:hypothetical protein